MIINLIISSYYFKTNKFPTTNFMMMFQAIISSKIIHVLSFQSKMLKSFVLVFCIATGLITAEAGLVKEMEQHSIINSDHKTDHTDQKTGTTKPKSGHAISCGPRKTT